MYLIKDTTAFVKAVKEFGRVVLITAVSAALAGAGVLVGFLDPFWAAIVTAVLSTLGKAWDKYIHESESTNKTGVVPF